MVIKFNLDAESKSWHKKQYQIVHAQIFSES